MFHLIVSVKKIVCLVVGVVLGCAPNLLAAVDVQQTGNAVVLANSKVALAIDLERRQFLVADVASKEVVLGNFWMAVDGWGRDRKTGKPDGWMGWKVSQTQESVDYTFGKGKRVLVELSNSPHPAAPTYLFSYTLYEGSATTASISTATKP